MTSFNDRIRRFQVWHVALPVRRPRDHGSGRVADKVEVVIVRLETSGGVHGWGEASPWSVFTGTAEAAMAALARYLPPVVLGRPVGDVASVMADADKALVGHPEAKAALETALLDCMGRSVSLPIWALLGGRARSSIPLSVSLADPDFTADLELLSHLRADGIGIVKLKTGTKGHAFDMMRLERLRSDYANLDIRVDYNQGMQPFEALRRLRDIEAFNVTFIEQPVPGDDRAAMAELTAALDTPILADESVFGPRQAIEAVRAQICDCISVKIMKCGGIRRGMEVAAIAEAAGMPAYGGDMFETGIAHLAGTHMIAAASNISLGCEFYQARYYLEDDLLAEPFPIDKGKVVVPNGPGLGHDVDMSKLKNYAIDHKEISAES